MLIFCRRIIVNKPALLKSQGPLLLACNHPNSFLDGMIFDILFDQPSWALARGDVFKRPAVARLLHAFKLLPVFRTSEGAENLNENYKTFEACFDIFRQNGIVQIFSEGKCLNEWHLRPLKKGTARLAISSWEKNIPLTVLPVGINYSAFRKFGKNIIINFGESISTDDIMISDTDGKRYLEFNRLLKAQLETLVFEINKDDRSKQEQLLARPASLPEKIIFFIPALLGYIIHAPLYLPIRAFVYKTFNHNDHFDSVMAALLLITYPLYVLLVTFLTFFLLKSFYVFFLLVLLPFTAWSCVLLKTQLDVKVTTN